MSESGPELRDIHLPADPSWWPPAPGWWLLALLSLGLLVMAVVWMRRRLARRRWRQRVTSELDRIAAEYSATTDALRLSTEVSQLLRRASRLLDPAAPALRGAAWLDFLDSILGGDDFTKGVGRVLLEGPYQRAANVDADALLDLARRWLQRLLENRKVHV
ncbi:DUF4381 domain-containing protein [Dokdonella sp.]|uniref:DUF4381 domain-containing protein n=1 Tax=Dokdonella sp. TaxID=2291710 RepID=UPI00352834FB